MIYSDISINNINVTFLSTHKTCSIFICSLDLANLINSKKKNQIILKYVNVFMVNYANFDEFRCI